MYGASGDAHLRSEVSGACRDLSFVLEALWRSGRVFKSSGRVFKFNISRGGYYYTTVAAKVSDFGPNLLKCC